MTDIKQIANKAVNIYFDKNVTPEEAIREAREICEKYEREVEGFCEKKR